MKECAEANLMLTYTAKGCDGVAGDEEEGGGELRVLMTVKLQ